MEAKENSNRENRKFANESGNRKKYDGKKEKEA